MLLKVLGVICSLLKERYGVSDSYSVGQVRKTMEDSRVPKNFAIFGYAIFMDRDGFYTVQREQGEQYDYEDLRKIVADLCFSGEISFTVKRALSYGGSSGNVGYQGVDGGIGGGDGGGGGGVAVIKSQIRAKPQSSSSCLTRGASFLFCLPPTHLIWLQ
jgi:hypothetical protein